MPTHVCDTDRLCGTPNPSHESGGPAASSMVMQWSHLLSYVVSLVDSGFCLHKRLENRGLGLGPFPQKIVVQETLNHSLNLKVQMS